MPERSYLRRAIKDTIGPFTEDVETTILGAVRTGFDRGELEPKLILDYIKNTTLPLITTGGGYNSTVALVKRGVTSLDAVADSELPHAVFLGKTMEKHENITRNPFQERDNSLHRRVCEERGRVLRCSRATG